MILSPKIVTFPKTQFIGINLQFTYANYRAFELWSRFMPRRNEIEDAIGEDLYNIQINPEDFDFSPHTPFVKWACRPVSKTDKIPIDMQILEIPEGLYTVFVYKGNGQDVASFFEKIYTEWLPNSGYVLDTRPQFEILGAKYKYNAPESEEEIYIPIKNRY